MKYPIYYINTNDINLINQSRSVLERFGYHFPSSPYIFNSWIKIDSYSLTISIGFGNPDNDKNSIKVSQVSTLISNLPNISQIGITINPGDPYYNVLVLI